MFPFVIHSHGCAFHGIILHTKTQNRRPLLQMALKGYFHRQRNSQNVFPFPCFLIVLYSPITEEFSYLWFSLASAWNRKIHCCCSFKVAEHSFQEPTPNSPLRLSYLRFGTCFLQELKLTTEEFILAFWLWCLLLPWQWGN